MTKELYLSNIGLTRGGTGWRIIQTVDVHQPIQKETAPCQDIQFTSLIDLHGPRASIISNQSVTSDFPVVHMSFLPPPHASTPLFASRGDYAFRPSLRTQFARNSWTFRPQKKKRARSRRAARTRRPSTALSTFVLDVCTPSCPSEAFFSS